MSSSHTALAEGTAPIPDARVDATRPAARLATGDRRRRPIRQATRSGLAGYALSAPYIVFLLAFGIGPTIAAVIIATTDMAGAFVGFANFSDLFHDFRFWPALMNVTAYMLCWLPFMIVMVLAVSIILQARNGRLEGFLRILYYLPGAFSGAAAVLLWIFVLDPNVGPFSFILGLTGWEYLSDVVTGDGLPATFAIIAFTVGAGSWIVIMHGALMSVGSEVEEAAQVDGVNAFQLAIHIQLPLMRKYIVYMVIMCVAAGLQIFIEPRILSTVLPGIVSPTWSLNQLAVTGGIQEGRLGESAALSLLLLAVGVIAALVLIFRTNFFDRERHES